MPKEQGKNLDWTCRLEKGQAILHYCSSYSEKWNCELPVKSAAWQVVSETLSSTQLRKTELCTSGSTKAWGLSADKIPDSYKERRKRQRAAIKQEGRTNEPWGACPDKKHRQKGEPRETHQLERETCCKRPVRQRVARAKLQGWRSPVSVGGTSRLGSVRGRRDVSGDAVGVSWACDQPKWVSKGTWRYLCWGKGR